MAHIDDFFKELGRRNVIRAGLLYVGGAMLLLKGLETVAPYFSIPNGPIRGLLIAAVIGLPFWLAFAWYFELTPDGIKREAEVEPATSITHHTRRRLDIAIFAVLSLVVVALLVERLVLAPQREAARVTAAVQAERTAATRAAVPIAPEQSIAVLPLRNEGGDPNDQYFSDGLSEDLITALSQFSGLKVIARDSAFRFRDSKDDSKTIGSQLGVAHLLQGSVRRLGDAVRISATLVKASDGSTLWSQRYDRPYKDLFALQDEITQAVSGALQAKLLANGAAVARSDRPASGNLAAYEDVLQGNFQLDRRNEADTRKAIGYYEQATKLDPAYAYAWARLGYARTSLLAYFTPSSRADQEILKAGARRAVASALRLAPDLAQTQLARTRLLRVVEGDFQSALRASQRAADLAPQDALVMIELGISQGVLGQFEEAIQSYRRAIALDPLSSRAQYDLGLTFVALGRYADAEVALRRAIELQPQGAQYRAYLAITQMEQGRAGDAVASARQEPDPYWRTWALSLAHRANGEGAASDAALNKLLAESANDGGSQIAQIYAQRKQPDEMFRWFDRALATGDSGIQEILQMPFVRDYRMDPRFATLCRKLGLPVPGNTKVAMTSAPAH